MDYLKPPTDNLYKFVAISGLLCFAAAIYLDVRWMNLLDQSSDLEMSVYAIKADYNFFALRGYPVQRLKEEIEKAEERSKSPLDIGPYRSPEEVTRAVDEAQQMLKAILPLCNVPAINDPDAKKLWTESRGISDNDYDKLIQNPTDGDTINRTIKEARELSKAIPTLPHLYSKQFNLESEAQRLVVAGHCFVGLGIVLILVGFGAWFWRVQWKQDAILYAEMLDSQKATP